MSRIGKLRNSAVLLCTSAAISFSVGAASAHMKVPVTVMAIDGSMSIPGSPQVGEQVK